MDKLCNKLKSMHDVKEIDEFLISEGWKRDIKDDSIYDAIYNKNGMTVKLVLFPWKMGIEIQMGVLEVSFFI